MKYIIHYKHKEYTPEFVHALFKMGLTIKYFEAANDN